jgi:hypothetical protein
VADALALLAGALERMVEPLAKGANSEVARRNVLSVLGWDIDELLGFPGGKLAADVGTIAGSAAALGAAAAGSESSDFGAVNTMASDIGSIFDAVVDLSQLAQEPGFNASQEIKDALGELGEGLLSLVVTVYLSRSQPLAYHAARLLLLVQTPSDQTAFKPELKNAAGNVVRYPVAPARVRFDRLGDLVQHPLDTLKADYMPNGIPDVDAAREMAGRLFGRLGPMLLAIGADVRNGTQDPALDPARTCVFHFTLPVSGAAAAVGAILEIVSDAEGGAGLRVTPTGWVEETWEARQWVVDLKVSGQIASITFRKGGPVLAGNPELSVGLMFGRRSLPGKPTVVGSPKGTRLELGTVMVGGNVDLAPSRQDLELLLRLDECAVVVAGGDGDGFLTKVLPKEGIRADFDFGLGWTRQKGVYFVGDAGLAVTLPIHASLLGVVRVDSIYAAMRFQQNGETRLVLAATGGVALGPISASVERIGLKATLTFPQGGGNLGPANLGNFAFKLPDGAGLSIGKCPVSGGGYLYIDEDKGQYAGILQLSFQTIGFTAIGLLNTKMADGSRGFSLLVIITAKFPPIQLGYGFVLTGAGGLLGVNRTVVLDVLRAGVKTHTIDAVLFPEDPVRDAPQIISALAATFPPVEGHYIFGPMVKLGWGGATTFILLELGIALELPSPIRLIIMGKLQLALPDPKDAILLLRLELLGIIDFDKGEASLDGTLSGSHVACFQITGDLAMRANWTSSPTFGFSAGGFHPAFTPPPNFPKLDRLAISLATGDNPRLRMDTYFAITSNTAQVGAHLDAYASADFGKVIGKFTFQAYMGFDALFQFQPLSLVAELHALVSLKRNDQDFLLISLDVTLSGPQPWHAWGQATFDLLGKHHVDFDVLVGEAPPPEIKTVVDPAVDLVAALAKPESWSAQLPPQGSMVISLREFQSTDVLAHPLGSVAFHQRVVPLNVEISRMGQAALAGANRFSVEVAVGGSPQSTQPLKDSFAAAQFFEMSDDEKLARPSFEQFDAGVRFDAGGLSHSSSVSTATLAYETSIVDVPRRKVTKLASRYKLDGAKALALAGAGAAAFSPLGESGAARFAGPSLGIVCNDPTWSVASRDDLSAQAGGARVSYSEAREEERAYATGHAGCRTQVVRSSEVAA